jgi:hypothetical protein
MTATHTANTTGQAHNVEEHVKVYLVLVDGEWKVDDIIFDGYPLDGLPDGPACVNGENGDHGGTCDAVKHCPQLPTGEQLFDLLGEALLARDTLGAES